MRKIYEEILEEFKKCALKAGDILIREYRKNSLKYKEKMERDYVSEVDFKVEEEVKKILSKKFKNIPFLGEEMLKKCLYVTPLMEREILFRNYPFFPFQLRM
ncbi:MAG: inositol monophosphatase family protein [candidate division WOR-3 bacterium]